MRAMKCDICGGYYDHYDELVVYDDGPSVPVNGIQFVSFEDDDDHRGWPCGSLSMDLCPNCIRNLIKSIDERKKNDEK